MNPVSEIKRLAYYLKDKPLKNRTMLITLDTEVYPEGVFLVKENLYLAVVNVRTFSTVFASTLAKFDIPVVTAPREEYKRLSTARIGLLKSHNEMLVERCHFASEVVVRPLMRRFKAESESYELFISTLPDAPNEFFMGLEPLGDFKNFLHKFSALDRNDVVDKIPSGTLVELASGVRLFIAYCLSGKYYLTADKNQLGRSSTGRAYDRQELRIVYD